MAAELELNAVSDGSVSRASVRSAIEAVTNISATSPVTPGFQEAAVIVTDERVTVRVQGHDGEWSQQSETALRQAIASVDGVNPQSIDVEGGFDGEPDESETDGTPAGEITGVGPQRAEQLADAGIETVADVREAGVEGLVAAGLSDGVAESIVDATDEM